MITYPTPFPKAHSFTFTRYLVPIGRTSAAALKLAAYNPVDGFKGGTLTNNTAGICWILYVDPTAAAPSQATVVDTGIRLQSSGGVLYIPDGAYAAIYAATNHTVPIEICSMFYKR
jgi:hypothetical protein